MSEQHGISTRSSGPRRAATVALAVTISALAALVTASAANLNVTSKPLTTHAHAIAATPTPTAPPATVTCNVFPPTDDTFVDQNAPAASPGSDASLSVRSRHNTNFTRFKRTFVRFSFQNLTSSPCQGLTAGSNIQSAVLALNVSTAPGASRTYQVQRVAGAWTEGALTWDSGVNADTDAQPVTSTAVVGTASQGQYITWDIKADLEAFLADPSVNHGWRIRDSGEDLLPTYETVFRSKEAGGLIPAVSIVYTP